MKTLLLGLYKCLFRITESFWEEKKKGLVRVNLAKTFPFTSLCTWTQSNDKKQRKKMRLKDIESQEQKWKMEENRTCGQCSY